ncbi:hypothetical protein CANINC_004785 [Pichia inconspicua]|uniref:Sulfite efflux pump SSU1 n=1 Tax=Pichia inconspicua TaxID=52247 RepID=A0A4T0WWB4_9ASCO|nr:hypothetical protein CANINC_004785 [[Candida] inconspicua]
MDTVHALVHGFKPLHFVAGMGIGMCASIMYNFPIESVRRGMKYVGYIYFFTNIAVIAITHLLFTLKFILFPIILPNDIRYKRKFFDLLHTPDLAVFMGASSMSLTSMINIINDVRPHWHTFVWVLWWINFWQALGCSFIVFFFIMTSANFQESEKINSSTGRLIDISPTLILPVITLTVTAACGAHISINVSNGVASRLITMLILTSMMTATAVCLSFVLLGVIFTKIFAFGIPQYGNAFSMFVPIGFLGQSSWCLLTNSKNVSYLIENHGYEIIGLRPTVDVLDTVHNMLLLFGIFSAISLTSFAISITIYGTFSVMYWYIGWPKVPRNIIASVDDVIFKIKKEFIFWTPTMWAATFPLGTVFLSTNAIYHETNIIGFKIVASIYAFAVVVITSWCMFCSGVYFIPWYKEDRQLMENELGRGVL